VDARPGHADCRPCADVCSLGQTCPGVSSGLPAGCTPCSNALPPNARWRSFECEWDCIDGFYLGEGEVRARQWRSGRKPLQSKMPLIS
jgi:hypothetical protein